MKQIGQLEGMNSFSTEKSGKVSLLLLWLIGVPVPILVIIFLMRGCTG